MSSLFRAELLRLVSRRLLLVLLVCMAGLAAFSAAVMADSTRPLAGFEIQQSRDAWAQDFASWEELGCDEDPTTEMCDGWSIPEDPDVYLRTPVSFGEYAHVTLQLGTPLMLLAVGVLAASFVGAEFSSGNIATQLLFTPRRTPMLVSKVVAAGVGALLLAVTYLGAMLAFTAIMFLALRGANDLTAGIGLPLMLGRGLVLAVLIAIMGAALTVASGSTLFTLGSFAVVLVGSAVVGSSISGFSNAHLFLPSNILTAMVEGSAEVYAWTEGDYGEGILAHVINYDWALGYSVAGAAIIVAASIWWFRRRDILT